MGRGSVARLAPQLAEQGGGRVGPGGSVNADLGPLAEAGDPSDRIERRWVEISAAGDPEFARVLTENLARLKEALLGPAPTAVEEVQVDMIVSTWLQKQFLTKLFQDQLGGQLGQLVRLPGNENLLGTWVKILDIPHSRFNQGFRVLNGARELSAKGVGPEGVFQGGPAEAVERPQLQQEAQAGPGPGGPASGPDAMQAAQPGASGGLGGPAQPEGPAAPGGEQPAAVAAGG